MLNSGTIASPRRRRRSRTLLRLVRKSAPIPGHQTRALTHGAVAFLILGLVALGGFFPVTVTGASMTPTLRASSLSMPGIADMAPRIAVTSLVAAPVPLTIVAPTVMEETLLGAADTTETTLSTLIQAQRDASVSVDIVSSREPERVPLYYRYEVQEGDTMTSIAGRFGLDTKYIAWNNAEVIDDVDVLSIGDRLQIPSVPGIIHGVRAGETLTEIALKYDAEIRDMIDFSANGLGDPNQLREGALILVVDGKRLPPPASSLRPGPDFLVRESSSFGFIWPGTGVITSYFNREHPLGIDIGMLYEPVAASAAGRVIFAGGDACCSYGLYVELDHGAGYETLYSHFSRIYVRMGQWVEQGQVLGISGRTGRSTGPHLHFELKRNGIIQNPLLFLP